MIGVALLSFFVWQHHLFQSGINPDMRPLFMLTTELISIPTGFIFLVGMGTLYKAKIRFEVPMLFCMAVFFNFLIGGVTGRVPVRRAGERDGARRLLRARRTSTTRSWVDCSSPSWRGLYYWLPKMTGRMMNKKMGLWHFWTMFVFFNLTFFPMFIIGLLGQPRRVFTYAKNLQGLNDFSSISAFLLGALVPDLLRQPDVVDVHQAGEGPGQPVGLARSRVADGDPDSVVQLRANSGRS